MLTGTSVGLKFICINEMISLNKLLFCLLFSSCFVLSRTNYSYGSEKDANKICYATSKDTAISGMLKWYFKEQLITNKTETRITFLRIAKLKKGYELRIGTVDSARTKSFLSSKKEKVSGFMKHGNNLIFLFGKEIRHFFSCTDTKSKFSFFGQQRQAERGKVPSAHTIHEPIVYVYKYQNGIITLIDKGRFSLLN